MILNTSMGFSFDVKDCSFKKTNIYLRGKIRFIFYQPSYKITRSAPVTLLTGPLIVIGSLLFMRTGGM